LLFEILKINFVLILFLLQNKTSYCIYQTNPCKICKCPSTTTATTATATATTSDGSNVIPNQIEDFCVSQKAVIVSFGVFLVVDKNYP